MIESSMYDNVPYIWRGADDSRSNRQVGTPRTVTSSSRGQHDRETTSESNETRGPRVQRGASDEYTALQITNTLPLGMPSKDIVDESIALYFQYCHKQPLWLFDQSELSKQEGCRDEVIFGILSLALRYSENPSLQGRIDQMCRQYAEAARNLIMLRISQGTVNLSTMQSLCLIALAQYIGKPYLKLTSRCSHLISKRHSSRMASHRPRHQSRQMWRNRHRVTRRPNHTFARSAKTAVLEHPPSESAIRPTHYASEFPTRDRQPQIHGSEHELFPGDGTEATADSPRELYFLLTRGYLGVHGPAGLTLERSTALRLALREWRSNTTVVCEVWILHHRSAFNGSGNKFPHCPSIRLGQVPGSVQGGSSPRPLVLESLAIPAIHLPCHTQCPQSPVPVLVATTAVQSTCRTEYLLENFF